MDVLGLGPAHVLGLSWGGTLAIEFAARHPEQLRSLILADTYAGWKGSLPEGECAERLRSCLTQSWMDPGEFIPAWMPTLFSPHAPDSVLIEMQTIMSEFHPAGFRTMARTVAATDNRHALTEIRVPTLLLWGEQDARSPLSVAESMLAAISDSCLTVIPHCGHVSNMEQPERFNEELRSFCRTVSAPTSLIA
jgi:pimeloyl-ACP methyl ester carboxylesterase